MLESIKAENRDIATQPLLRAALFYRGIVNAVSERQQDVIVEIMNEGEDDARWNAAEAADLAIKEWSDFLEIRED